MFTVHHENKHFWMFTVHRATLKHPPQLTCHPGVEDIAFNRNVGTTTLHTTVHKPRTATAFSVSQNTRAAEL